MRMHYSNIGKNQSGFASIVIALVMVLVMALLSVGFAQLARREQGSALDKQLAIQAYYAAESGINEVIDKLEDNPTPFLDPSRNRDACLDASVLSTPSALDNSGTATGANYGCVLVDPDPPEIKFGGIPPGAGRHITFSTDGVANQLLIKWGSTTAASPTYNFGNGSSVGQFQPRSGSSGDWPSNRPAVLQISVTPIGGVLQRETLMSSTFHFYAYPSSSGGSINWGNGKGTVVGGNCSGTGPAPCSVTLNSLPAASEYLVHVIAYYDETNVSIGPQNAGLPVDTKDGQAVIDVTGKAKDVLKRLQVRVPIKHNIGASDYAFESQSACKRIQTSPDDPGDPNNTTSSRPSGYGGTACDLSSIIPPFVPPPPPPPPPTPAPTPPPPPPTPTPPPTPPPGPKCPGPACSGGPPSSAD